MREVDTDLVSMPALRTLTEPRTGLIVAQVDDTHWRVAAIDQLNPVLFMAVPGALVYNTHAAMTDADIAELGYQSVCYVYDQREREAADARDRERRAQGRPAAPRVGGQDPAQAQASAKHLPRKRRRPYHSA